MATLDDIAQERKRIAERLVQLDAERTNLAEELAELEVAERVLARFSQTESTIRKRVAVNAGAEAGKRRSLRQPRSDGTESAETPALSLGEATLRAVSALGNGVSAEDVRHYLDEQLGMRVRPNHLGMALQRHRRAGRLEQRDSRWWSPDTEAAAFAAG